MSEKVIGYILLAAGILLIILTTFSMYNVFTKKSKPVELFNLGGISLDLSQMLSGDLSPAQREQLAKSNFQTETEIIKEDLINAPLNYAAHLMLMSFIAGAGFKIAKLGVMFLRPIKVKLKSQEAQ
jgi:hypothetical protein